MISKHKLLKDVLELCFKQNYEERPKAVVLLEHPFFDLKSKLDVPSKLHQETAMELKSTREESKEETYSDGQENACKEISLPGQICDSQKSN